MTDYCRDNARSTPVFRNDENQAICADGSKSACRELLWYIIIEILPLLNILLTLSAYVLSRHRYWFSSVSYSRHRVEGKQHGSRYHLDSSQHHLWHSAQVSK